MWHDVEGIGQFVCADAGWSHSHTHSMGRERKWSEAGTLQLCRSWIETSEDAYVGTDQKRQTLAKRIYTQWLNNKDPADAEEKRNRDHGRLKKVLPKVTKLCGMVAKVKSEQRSGWDKGMYVDAVLTVYSERKKHSFEFLTYWCLL